MSLWSLLNIWSKSDKVWIYVDDTGGCVYEGQVRDMREYAELSKYYNSVVTHISRGTTTAVICIAH